MDGWKYLDARDGWKYLDASWLATTPPIYPSIHPSIHRLPNNPHPLFPNYKKNNARHFHPHHPQQEPEEMHPWYRGFVGSIEPKPGGQAKDKGSYTVAGVFRRVDDVTVEVGRYVGVRGSLSFFSFWGLFLRWGGGVVVFCCGGCFGGGSFACLVSLVLVGVSPSAASTT